MLYACIFIPDFPVQAILRAEPDLRDYAVVVLDGRGPVERPLAMNEHARRKGVQFDLPKNLLEQCSSLLLRPRSPAFERVAQQALERVAKDFSPRLEAIAPGTVLMDLAGMARLGGPPEALGREIGRRLEALGLTAHVALAANPDAALSAARGMPGITVLPPGREAQVLGPLPLTVLDPPAEMLATLARWGIRDFHGLAALPTAELSERLGQPGVELQARARGKFLRPLMGAEPTPEFVARMELDCPIEDLESLAFVLNQLLGDLCARLNAYAAAAQQIDLHLDLEAVADVEVGPDASPAPGVVAPTFRSAGAGRSPGAVTPRADLKVGATTARAGLTPGAHDCAEGAPSSYAERIPLPVPTRDAKLLLNLLRLNLEADPPAAPILKVALRATPARPRVGQGGLFAPLAPDPEKLEITLARIAGLVGPRNVGSPQLLDTHQPGAFAMRPFAAYWEGGSKLPHSKTAGPDREHLTLRIYRPAVPAAVWVRNDVPVQLAFRGMRGRVVVAGGPWRTSGGWWRPEAWQYDEWDLETEAAGSGRAGFYRIYLDRATEKWFVRGEYD
jgi:protein ImuB